MDRFLLMSCFARAVETGSFSAAGRDLGLGQPNVSRYVAALEDHLQARLLHRSTRKLSLTPERSEEHTSELQSPCNLVCRLLLEKKKNKTLTRRHTLT